MKKLNFLAVAAMLFAAITLTGCDSTDGTDGAPNGDGTEIPDDKDGDGGGNGDIRLVDKVEWDDGDSRQLFYDDQNRVVKIEDLGDGFLPGDYSTLTYSYGANTFTEAIAFYASQSDDEDGSEPYSQKGLGEDVYGLNSEGYIISQTAHSWKWWRNGELRQDENGVSDMTYSYENGYLKTYTNSDAGGGSNDYGNYTTSSVTEYFWENGNLIKTVETGTYKYVDGTIEDRVITTETTYTYSDKINFTNVGYNLNAVMFGFGDDSIDVLSAGGLVGKLPKNLVSSETVTYDGDYTFVTEYDWELDSEGYVTKMTETGDSYTDVTTVTYKN